MTTENIDLGKSLYESFVRGEYDRDWSTLPAGVKARWNEVAKVNRCVTVTISADNATITKAIEKLQAEIAIVFQQHRAALAEISRGLALAGNRLQRLSLEFVMGSSQAIEVSEWAEEARATIENAPHFREDSHPAPEGHLREALAAIVAIGDAEPRTIHDQQTQRYSQKAIDIARKALAATPSPETHLRGSDD
jgi:hypothetical protein